MQRFTTFTVCACLGLASFGCGSSSDGESTPAPTEASTSAQDQAASHVCDARADIQSQVGSLTTLSAGSAAKDVTSALEAIAKDLQAIKAAQADLAPERKQQVQDATTAFGAQLKDIVRQHVAGLATTDPKTQAESAATSLKAAVTQSLSPIEC